MCETFFEVVSPSPMAFPMTQGRNTPPLNSTGVHGKVVAVSPWEDKACGLIDNAESLDGNIVLVPDGHCMYNHKILNVQAAGAVAVIIVHYEDNVVYPGMTGSSMGLTIPGVLIGLSNGTMLKNLLDQGETVMVNLTDSNKRDSPTTNLLRGSP